MKTLNISEPINTMRTLKIPLCLTGLLIFVQAYTRIPEGGISLISEKYNFAGNGSSSETIVEGQPFSRAVRTATGPGVTNMWDSRLSFEAVEGISKGDVILIAFLARTIESVQETGEGIITICIEHRTTHSKELYRRMPVGREWRQYFIPITSNSTLDASSVNYSFHLGSPRQVLEFADVKFINYRRSLSAEDLPVTRSTYAGREPDAPWREEAAARIHQHRRGPIEIAVRDQYGNPAVNARVTIEMVRHEFGFGSAISGKVFESNPVYREKVLELFNEVVFENDLKWGPFTSNRPNEFITRTLDELDKKQIRVRGHTVVWPSFRYNPSFLRNYADDPDRLRSEIENHIKDITTFTRGRLVDWDVLNEPYSEQEFQEILGYEVMADWFRLVRKYDPGVKLYINDYSIISGLGMNIAHQDHYYQTIRFIEENGGQIDGIGMQGHFGYDLTSIPQVYSILERFAALGKDIKITEHDIQMQDRGLQADYTRDLMTILYSHPSVKSLLVWGFWTGRHWRPDAAFYDDDWNIRPHGKVWKELVFDKWWTPVTTVTTGGDGIARFEGYLGDYKYRVIYPEKEVSGLFRLENPNSSGLANKVIVTP
jgi:endo-1,4-beta-xylanase